MCVLIGSARPNPNGYIRASGIWPKSNKPDFGPHKLKILLARIWIYIIIYIRIIIGVKEFEKIKLEKKRRWFDVSATY